MHKYFSTGQFKNVIKAVHETARYHNIPVPTLKFNGTVKLHGTNGSVFKDYSLDSFVTQSKNNIITPQEDNMGFSTFLHNPKEKNVIENVFKNIKSIKEVDNKVAVIYGEWCGGSIQKNVALQNLEKMFVIFAIKITDNTEDNNQNEYWLTKDEMNLVLKDLDKDVRIFNSFSFKNWVIEIDMDNPKLSQNKLIEITNSVEAECPVGKHFGVIGIGEGVVWKCESDNPIFQKDTFTFKVKGQEHSVSHVKTIAEVDTEKVQSIKEFVEKVVTDNRLQQGIDYLNEQKLDLLINNMGTFLRWVVTDCFKEESDILEQSGLDKKEVAPAISNHAKKWYLTYINENIVTNKIKP